MAKRKLRPALEILSDIGCLGFDLQHHSDEAIEDAMKFMRISNPEMFAYLSRVLAAPKADDAVARARLDSAASPNSR